MLIGIITGSGTYSLPGFAARRAKSTTEFRGRSDDRRSVQRHRRVHVSRPPGRARAPLQRGQHQANIAALRDAGVQAIVAATVCGAVDPTVPLGSLIAFDDLHFLANRLPDGSLCTLHTEPGRPGRAHWVYDRPYSPEIRAALNRCRRRRARA